MRATRISGMVFAAGIGAAVATGTPVAVADDTDGPSASDTSNDAPADTGDKDDEPTQESVTDDGPDDADPEDAELDDVDPEEAELDEDSDDELLADEDSEDEEADDAADHKPDEVIEPPTEVIAEPSVQRSLRIVENEPEPTVSAIDTVVATPEVAEVPAPEPLRELVSLTVAAVAAPTALRVAPAPALVPAPVVAPSPPRLLTGLLGLVGLGPSTGARPGLPVLPSLPRLIELVFVAIRQTHQYIWHNSTPTITPELVDEDVDTGVRIYDLGIADADNDRLVVTVTQPANGTLERNVDGTYTYTPNADVAYVGGLLVEATVKATVSVAVWAPA